jgi:hypothetical protein
VTASHPPSLDVPEVEKRAYTEADVHSKLFDADMRALGYPPRSNTQADGEHFLEQGRLAVRRLRSRRDRAEHGHYDGMYLLGNAPVVLCELKRYDALDPPAALERAIDQLLAYALSEDFATPPPFLVLYCGKSARNRWFRLRTTEDGTVLDQAAYDPLPEPWSWARVKEAHLRGSFAEEVVDRERLLEILLHHLDRVEDDLRADVAHAVTVVTSERPERELLADFGHWLLANPEAMRRTRLLYERKVAEIGSTARDAVIEEIVTQAALNYVNKVFFLNLCEDRNLAGFTGSCASSCRAPAPRRRRPRRPSSSVSCAARSATAHRPGATRSSAPTGPCAPSSPRRSGSGSSSRTTGGS